MELRFFSFSLSFPAGRLGADPDAHLKSKLFDKGGGEPSKSLMKYFMIKTYLRNTPTWQHPLGSEHQHCQHHRYCRSLFGVADLFAVDCCCCPGAGAPWTVGQHPIPRQLNCTDYRSSRGDWCKNAGHRCCTGFVAERNISQINQVKKIP